MMITFTYQDDDKYFKMQVMNEIKNYLSKLISNTKSDTLKFFSNIELGDDYSNPHVHAQIFYDNYSQIIKIRNKVIEKFGLFSEFCEITMPEHKEAVYSYIIKDYDKCIADDKLLLLDTVRRDYRGMLKKKIRFTSMSKEKYTKLTYKKAYSHGIKKEFVDGLLDDFIINKEIEIIDNRVIHILILLILTQIRIKYKYYRFAAIGKTINQQIQVKNLIYYWIYGFI